MTFPEDIIWEVWSKGYPDSNDPLLWRHDECGAWIFRGDYDRKDSEYGWEIDHIISKSDGGTDDISNLRPLHWENMERGSDGRLVCRIIANGSYNVRRA
jgi:hypothetical protein